ncbi:chloride transporter, chloride channel (ClC) family protein, partial [mine drainage metagenome]
MLQLSHKIGAPISIVLRYTGMSGIVQGGCAMQLRDFSTDGRRLALLTAISVLLGMLSAGLAFVLLRLIGLITHLSYYGTWRFSLVAPEPSNLGIASVLVPVAGGIVVGLMARFGSEKIRGHGIPEAIQSILEHDSCISPRVAMLKPIAS